MNEEKRRYIAIAECVNTYELEITQEPKHTFEDAVDALLELLGDEYSYRHHWLCKVIVIDTDGTVHDFYSVRSGTSKPSTNKDNWSRQW